MEEAALTSPAEEAKPPLLSSSAEVARSRFDALRRGLGRVLLNAAVELEVGGGEARAGGGGACGANGGGGGGGWAEDRDGKPREGGCDVEGGKAGSRGPELYGGAL